MRGLLSTVMGTAVVLGATVVGAQDLNTTVATPATTTSTGGSITDTSGPTDHSVVVGHLGLRYFGTTTASILQGSSGNPGGSLTLHTVGVRYWLNSSLGLEGGLTLGVQTGSTTQTTVAGGTQTITPSDDPNAFGFGLRVGLPIALADSKHVTISLVPTIAFAFASSAIQSATMPGSRDVTDYSHSWFALDLGANAQAELHFGFIGIPQLSLIAQFGLGMRYQSTSTNADAVPSMTQQQSSTNVSKSNFNLATTLGAAQGAGTGGAGGYSLADIITGAISAVWYFGGSPGR